MSAGDAMRREIPLEDWPVRVYVFALIMWVLGFATAFGVWHG